MDDQLEEILKSLVNKVKESQEYKEYRRMLEVIKQDPEKERAVNEFRRRNFEMQKRRDVDLFTEVDRLEGEFAPLRSEPYVNEYLSVELALCRLVQHINYSLMMEMDFELGFELY